MAGSCMNGPRRLAERDEGSEERRFWPQLGALADLIIPGSEEQNNNDLTNHKQTQSCHQQSKIDEFFSSFLQSAHSRPKNIFYCILICIELATDRQTNNNTN